MQYSGVMRHDMVRGELLGQIREYVKSALDLAPEDPNTVPMSYPTFGEDEVMEAIDSLLLKEVTMGRKVERFEQMFADYVGSKHAIMVNSGSTANLLMMSVLSNPDNPDRLKPGDEVIVPALTWGTTLWPVIQMGCVPVLVDCDPETLCMTGVEEAISEKTKAIFAVHILGNSCDMDYLTDIANRHDLYLIEDACESLGTEYKGTKVGTIGNMGAYSFYFSHHITTIEGGMVVTDDDKVADLLRTLRAHGWTRHLHDKSIEGLYPHIDPKFMFCNIGYSVRPTEIQGAFGIHQLYKLNAMNDSRMKIAMKLLNGVNGLDIKTMKPTDGAKHTWFGFPMILNNHDRDKVCEELRIRGIDTRPVIAGNLAEHPVMEKFEHRVSGDLKNCKDVMANGFYIGTSPDMTQDQLNKVIRSLVEIL